MVPVKSQNQVIGAISTFRDKTEISQLMQRIDGMVNYVDALRSHTHEFMNKLHVILGLLHMKRYDKLEEYIIQTAQNYQTDIGAIQRKVKSPVIAGFLLGKINRAKEAGVTLTLAEESQLPDTSNEEQVAVSDHRAGQFNRKCPGCDGSSAGRRDRPAAALSERLAER